MHKNQMWLAVLAVFALIALWFSATTGYELYWHASMMSKASPKGIQWKVYEKSRDRYALTAVYDFDVRGNIFEGKTSFQQLAFRNQAAAEQAISQYAQKPWTIWYAALSPQHSTIQKAFPLKSCIYTAILWGLFLYFIWLGWYVEKKCQV